MNIAIIGGGISGLSIAQMLKENNNLVVFEAEGRPGGMIKCDRIKGHLFHRTGGHVFNTKRSDVMLWFWKHFDKEKEFIKATRNSTVHIGENLFIPYPIENHSYMFDKEMQVSIINDWLAISKVGNSNPQNFSEFLRKRFGNTLYKIYFEPYNKKVWRRDLAKVPLDWLDGKLPMPTVEEMFFNNMNHIEEKNFVHSSFFYPENGGSQFIANRLSEGLNIVYNSRIDEISYKNKLWNIHGVNFDKIIYSGNVKQIPTLLQGNIDISEYEDEIDKLDYHGTTSVFCKMEKNPYSWIYIPNNKYKSHRIICTGNFSKSNNPNDEYLTGTVEYTDNIKKEEIVADLQEMPFNPQLITYNYEKYTYPIQNSNTRNMIDSLSKRLEKDNFYLLGRFAKWEYSNMDVCIGAALDLSKRLYFV